MALGVGELEAAYETALSEGHVQTAVALECGILVLFAESDEAQAVDYYSGRKFRDFVCLVRPQEEQADQLS
jgi:hypothetical protein